jgi:Ca2+-binding RTX toxin-like protein
VLNGGADNDVLTRWLGRDFLAGGTGREAFRLQHLAGSRTGANCDLIIGFTRGNNVTGDAIDLRTIGAKTVVAGNQAFHFSREGRNQRPLSRVTPTALPRPILRSSCQHHTALSARDFLL